MNTISNRPEKGFRITKWFMDFIGPDGNILIVYAAELAWKGGVVPYTNILWKRPDKGISKRYRFSRRSLPKRDGDRIIWKGKPFGLEGVWKAIAEPLQARLYESDNQVMDWQCWQPLSKVTLTTSDGIQQEGMGYAEVITTTFSAWEIPMRELRWGHMVCERDWAVWIELKGETRKQWVWWNGEKRKECLISDPEVTLPDLGVTLKLDRSMVLEKEQKVNRVAGKIVGFIPGFSRILPKAFLLSHQTMWASRAKLYKEGQKYPSGGWAIHELLDATP